MYTLGLKPETFKFNTQGINFYSVINPFIADGEDKWSAPDDDGQK